MIDSIDYAVGRDGEPIVPTPDPLIRVLGVRCGECGLESDGGWTHARRPVDYPFLMRRSEIRRQAAERRCPDCGGQLIIELESPVPA